MTGLPTATQITSRRTPELLIVVQAALLSCAAPKAPIAVVPPARTAKSSRLVDSVPARRYVPRPPSETTAVTPPPTPTRNLPRCIAYS
jgi:hypothetical protein